MEDSARKTHPMIIVAAIAVTVASLAAIANFTGLVPAKSAPETTLTAAAPPPPARPHKTQQVERGQPPPTGDLRYTSEQTTTTYPPNTAGVDVIPARPAAAPPPICHECGIIEAVREMTKPAEGSGLGAVAGGVLGGLLGHQIGQGRGNTAATVVGAVGGAVAGHQVEKQVRAEKQLQVTVRFEDGSIRTIDQEGGSRWQVGDRVRLNNGALLPN